MKISLVPLNEKVDLKMVEFLVDGAHPLPENLDEPTRTYLKELIDIVKRSTEKLIVPSTLRGKIRFLEGGK